MKMNKIGFEINKSSDNKWLFSDRSSNCNCFSFTIFNL